jgi:ethanolamine ammonia-lyase small subunit
MELDKRTLLEGLAEEAAELGKAALKAIRAFEMSENVTPVTRDQAGRNLDEELVDVLMVACAMGYDLDVLVAAALQSPKWERWERRLTEGTKECKQ